MRRTWAIVACLLVGAGAAGGCGSDDDDRSGGPDGPPRELLRVGVIPVANTAPLYLGIEQGFFAEEGLNVRPQLTTGGGATVAAVLGGSIQVGLSDTVSILVAASQEQPVEIIAQGALGARRASGAWESLLALEDGPIDSLRDLEGKTIAINRVGGACEVTVKRTLELARVDLDTIVFEIVPFPQMNAALAAGRADAACAIEPFVTEGEAGGAVGLAHFYLQTAPDLSVVSYFTNGTYSAENPGLIIRFVTAMNRSLDYARDHPDEARAIIPTYADIDPELLDRMELPKWRSELTIPTIEELSRLSLRYGVLEREPDISELIRDQPSGEAE